MNKKSLFLAFLFSLSGYLFAQDAITLQQNGVDLDVLYRNESSGSFIIHNHGMGANYRRGKHVTGFKTRFLDFDLVTMKHPKQTKTTNGNSLISAKGFYYGKLNSVAILRAGVGFQRIIFGKAGKERKSVEIRSITSIGPSLGLAKPVYLEILRSPSEFVPSTERYDPEKHQLNDIYGRSPYSKGVSEMKFHPGGYIKLGLSVEYADLHNDIKAIEVGAILDAYPKAIPMMATEKNSPLLFSLYINFIYGKRWF